MAEFFPLIVDGDQEHEKKEKDKKQRFSSINIATKKAVSSWLSPSEALSKSSLEHRMPVSVVAPELSKEQPYTPAAPTHYSEAWLGSAVRPPEYQVAAPALSHEAAKDDEEDDDNKEEGEEQSTGDLRQPQSEVHDRQESPAPVYAAEAIEPAKNPAEVQGPAEDDAFQRLLKRAGLDELSRSLEVAPEPSVSSGEEVSSNIPEMPAASNVGTGGNGGEEQPPSHDSAAEAGDPAEGRPTGAPVAAGAVRMPSAEQPRDVDHSEYILRTQARTRALVAFAAGLIIGNHFGKKRVRRELTRALEEVEEKMTTNETQQQFAQRQVERQTYNENSWQHRQGQSEQQPAFTPPQERTPLLTTTGEVEPVTAEDPFHLQPEEHVERDAWHSIVVDKYGREDVSARQQYGKAFEQEQREVRKSALSDDTPTSKDGRDTVNTPSANSPTPTLLPTTPLSQQPMQSRSNPADQMLPAGLTQPQLPIGPPVRGDSQHLLPAHVKTGVSVLLNPWVWLFVGLLILVFFGASLFG